MTRNVVILTAQVRQYRRTFLADLATRLHRDDVVLKVAYSDPNRVERAKADSIGLPRDIGVEVPGVWLLGGRVLVQLAWREVRDADLVVMDQGNKHMINYLLIALSRLGKKRVAYWGHGYNRQARTRGASEWIKRKLLTSVDWWFAYTDGVGRYLADHGVDPGTITVVQNTIDTRELADAVRELDDGERRAVRDKLGIARDACVGLFCGSLYADKKLALLIAAAQRIRALRPDFELIVVGDGPERDAMQAAAAQLPFVHYVGPAFGPDRAAYFAISDVFLNPGLVGLAIVDAFTIGLPVFTTDIPIHSPEIEYLAPGVNGVMTAYDAGEYAAAVCRAIGDSGELARMRRGARATAERLTLDHMVEAFATGITQCLEARS